MGKDFYDNYDVAKKLFNDADDALGYSIKDMCFNGSADDLQLTANTQPAILVVSVIVNEILKSEGVTPSIAAGHSLGEYSALVSAGVIEFKDAVLLVHKRGQFMQEAVPVGEGAMAAIIGLDDQIIIDTCADVALGSDAFFPFFDNIERAYKSGVKYIAEPGGSIRDHLVIECCDKHDMVMAFTGMRLFHH